MSRRFPRRSSRSPEWWRQPLWCLRSWPSPASRLLPPPSMSKSSRRATTVLSTLRAPRAAPSRWRQEQPFQSLPHQVRGDRPWHGCARVDQQNRAARRHRRDRRARAISRFPRVWPPPRGASGRIWPTADATCATGIIPAGAKRGGRILLAARGDRPVPARRAGVPPVRASARIAGPPHHALHVHRARRARRGRLAMREARAIPAMSVPLAGRLLPKARFPASSAPLVPSAAPLGERLAALPSASTQAIPPRG